jgi:hypothetical protein
MNILTRIALTLALVLTASVAQAALQQFPDFSVDLPKDWSVSRDSLTTLFLAPDKSATLTVTVESTAHMANEGVSVEELVEAWADKLHGTRPVQEEPNCYSFTFTSPQGLPAEASVVVSGRRFYLITISGKHKDLARMVESVLISIP